VIDAYASLRHYAEHIRPVWDALPDQLRGQWLEAPRLHRRDPARTVLVASWRDAQQVAPSPLVYVEHGAGQTYDADPRARGNGSYSGGAGLDRVRLFLCPNAAVADRWRAAYRAPAAVVGCPKLDRWHRAARDTAYQGARPTVAVTFHWECALVPETRSAWRHYDRALPVLAHDPRWRLLGHGHPRLWGTIRRRWQQLGVDHTPDLADVLDQADLLVADNTSALYEFASLGKPVLVLNAPWYRRDVHHGLRFWSHPPGLQCDQPTDLPDQLARALADPPAAQRIRAAAVAEAYAHTDGLAAQRAATAIAKELHHA
jgi:hypothetical protein